MSAPNISVSVDRNSISSISGFNTVTVTVSSDSVCTALECRATRYGDDWGLGKGTLLASLSEFGPSTEQTFTISSDMLSLGDGKYRIDIFAQGEDGSWNDVELFVPSGASLMMTSDGKLFCVSR